MLHNDIPPVCVINTPFPCPHQVPHQTLTGVPSRETDGQIELMPLSRVKEFFKHGSGIALLPLDGDILDGNEPYSHLLVENS